MVKVTLKDGTVVEGTSEEIYALDLFVETDEVESVEVEEAPLAVGDYYVVIKWGIGGAGVFTPGQIVKVTFVKDSLGNVQRPMVKSLDGREEWYMTIGEEIRKATDEEVASAKAQAKVDAIERKRTDVFTANGRKVNEYRKGDIARYVGNASVKGELVEVESDTCGDRTKIRFQHGCSSEFAKSLEPIAFVENRLDR